MGMKSLEQLRDMLCMELDEIADKGELSAGDLDTAHKLTDTIKNIDKIEMLESGDYSEDGGWEARGNYSRADNYPMNPVSYGRMSRSGERGSSYARGRYSRADGMEHIAVKLRELMRDGNLNARQQETIKAALKEME